MPKNDIAKLKKALRQKPDRAGPPDYSKGLSTGSSLLNLACTGRTDVGFLPGHYYLLVGDSGSGKTFLTLTAFAEAMLNPVYRDYRLIHDNAENGALMDFSRFFGKRVAERVAPPAGTWGKPRFSRTTEEFYGFLYDALQLGEPFVYILDSMDALTTEAEEGKFRKKKKAREEGGEEKGSYGTSKAKINSEHLRVVFSRLRQSPSILLVIAQTRDNIGFNAMFNPKTRGGGHALTFYATLEWHLSVKGHLKTTVRGRPVEQGVLCKVRIKKNRQQGKDRTVLVPILHQHGIDDVGGMVDWLVEWKHWTGNKASTRVEAPEFDWSGSREKLIRKVQEEERERELRLIVSEVWGEIEEEASVERKRKYE